MLQSFMKILVTGGAGFIGSHVVEAYLAAGHEVAVVDDLSTGSTEEPARRSVSFYLMNIGSPELAKVFEIEKPQVVNHHAAQISVTVSAREPVRDATVNGLGLLNVLECSRAAGVKKFIFISSGGADLRRGRRRRDSPRTTRPSPVSPYAIHKLLGEHYLRFYGAQHGLEWTALRYSNVFGPRQNPLGEAGVVAIFISKVLAGEIPVVNAFPEEPDGMARDYVYVEDVARANLLALDKGAGEAVNIATAREVRTRELLAAICRIIGKELKYTRGGPRPGDIRRSCLDNAKAARVLGWKPGFSLDEGLGRTVVLFQRIPCLTPASPKSASSPAPGAWSSRRPSTRTWSPSPRRRWKSAPAR